MAEQAAFKATRILNFLRRNFYAASKTVKSKLYSTLVRPHLEYASVAWNPHNSKDIYTLERVQRRAARFACGDFGRKSSVSGMLNDLGWSTLEERENQTNLSSCIKSSTILSISNRMLCNRSGLESAGGTITKCTRSEQIPIFTSSRLFLEQ